jgi:[ribosomal protein S5]-alanine N-acetyltransferase
MFIRTERLFLRPGWPEDFGEVHEAIRNGPVVRTYGLGAMREDADALQDYLIEPDDPRFPHLFMFLRSAGDARLVGAVALDRRGGEIELRYWMVRRFLGQGYAAEAVRAVLAHARMLGHRRIVASHFLDGDAASAYALESAGFSAASAHSAAILRRMEDAPSIRTLAADLAPCSRPKGAPPEFA